MLFVFVSLLICAFTLLVLQYNNLYGEIDNNKAKLAGLEKTITEQQIENKDIRNIEVITAAIESIKSSSIPVVENYNNIFTLLTDSSNFISYEVLEGNQIIVDIQVNTLPEIAAFISKLQDQLYVSRTEATSISLNEGVYQATLTVSFDPKALPKEFKQNE